MTLNPTLRNWLMAVVSVALGAFAMGLPSEAQQPLAGSQGTDTSLPLTDSAVTVAGRGEFADLRITINQTENLTNQAVSLQWTGAEPTFSNGRTGFAGNFLQIMQCWGDDDESVPGNPGPPPEQCVAGATTATPAGLPGNSVPAAFATTRQLFGPSDGTYDASAGFVDSGGNVWRRFRAVDGTVIGAHVDEAFNPFRGGNYWLNPYFDISTTNEIVAGATSEDGSGIGLVQVLTGVQSTGLGCGQRTQSTGDGSFKVPKCWIVVVPRGTPQYENADTTWAAGAAETGVATSPLTPQAWANRIAIPIEFNPVDSPCDLAAQDRRLAGNELVAAAVANWQPLLCGNGRPPYSYAPIGDVSARQILINRLPGSAGMIAVSRPLDSAVLSATNPVVYAPLSLSGLAIGFNLERIPSLDAPPEQKRLAGIRVAEMQLTPRLVAKLLTQSYTAQIDIVESPNYDWARSNPGGMHLDRDFLRFNPEFRQLQVFDARLFSGLQLPAGTSDAARQVWEWVLADPEAAEWLAGEPDEFGMNVNPRYATVASRNASGFAFGAPIPNSFPKAEPYCYTQPFNGTFTPPPLCGTDWSPYARSFDDAASRARVAADFARIAPNPSAQSTNTVWRRTTPQVPGRRAILSLTDTASAVRYGLQTAGLSRAGDDDDERRFIKPTDEGLTLGATTMAPVDEPQVLEPRPISEAPGAYPLTTLTYAATTPRTLDKAAQIEYSAFLEYAVGPGQVPGLKLGELPPGYVPLPEELRAQTRSASIAIASGLPAPSPPSTTTPPTTSSPAPTATAVVPTTTPPNPPPASGQSFPVSSPPRAGTPRQSSSSPIGATESAAEAELEEVASVEASAPGSTIADGATATASSLPPTISAATPATGVGPTRIAVPALAGLSLGAALLALEMTKRPRRAQGALQQMSQPRSSG